LGLLIGYLLGFALACTYRFNKMEGINSMKIVLCSLFYPLEFFVGLVNLILIPCGVYLQFEIAVLLNQKESEAMTDKTMQELRDTLKDLDKSGDDNEQK
jgi:cell division protein FtsX